MRTDAKIAKSCKWCGTKFEVYRCHFDRKVFCSIDCQKAWRRSLIGEKSHRFGIPHNEETRKVISQKTKEGMKANYPHSYYWLRRNLTDEMRAVISQKAKERCQDRQYREKLREYGLRGLVAQRRHPNHMESYLNQLLHFHFGAQWRYTGDGEGCQGLMPDFSHYNYKAIIELFGDYWHSDAKVRTWKETELGRVMAYNSLGFRCLVIWEHELKDEQAVIAKIGQFMRRK